MAYPFAGFGPILFERNEMPLLNTDTLWVPKPVKDQTTPLGASRDDIQLLGFGSQTRSWEAYFEPSRHALLAALVGTTALLVDFTRPTPGQWLAYLDSLGPVAEHVGRAGAPFNTDPADQTGERRRIRLNFASQ